MTKMLILDQGVSRELIRERKRHGTDRYDEVWEGVYVMPSQPANVHQGHVALLVAVLWEVIVLEGRGRVFPGANVTDRRDKWKKNFRVPDVVVVLNGSRAVDCLTHWFGGPDFLIEIRSPEDDVEAKLPFYSKIGVRELLVVDRDQLTFHLYRHDGHALVLVGESAGAGAPWLASEVVPLAFRCKSTKSAAAADIKRTDGKKKTWTL